MSLYNPHIATMEADPTKAYNQDDATGFIRLNALRLKVAAKVQKKNKIGARSASRFAGSLRRCRRKITANRAFNAG